MYLCVRMTLAQRISLVQGVKHRYNRTRQKGRINSHSSSRIGRNVTLDVICFIISLISPWTSFSVFWCFFAGLPPGSGVFAAGFEGSSVCMSNCHRSSVSSVSTDLIARTRRLIDDDSSHTACQLCSPRAKLYEKRACLLTWINRAGMRGVKPACVGRP